MVLGIGSSGITIVIRAKDQFSKVFNRISLSMANFRTSALAAGAVGAVIAVGMIKAINSAVDFNSAMIKSTAIMGDLSEAMTKDMSKAAREMAKVTTFSAVEAADSYFFLASAGLDAKASIAALPVVAQFAQAGMFDMALATDLLTDAQSALGLTIRDDAIKNMQNMIGVSDVLVKANTLANASVQQFSESLTSEAGAALKSFNKDIEEGVAVLAALADQGVKGQKAGTDLSRIMRLMAQASNKNKEELEELNIEVFDSSGKMKNFADIINDMENAFAGMSDEQRTAALSSIGFTARVQGVILPLLGTSDAIRIYEEELRKAGGITDEVANKQLKSFQAQINLTKSALTDVGITIGNDLMPILTNFLLPAIKKLISFWESLSDPVRQAIIVLGLVTIGVTTLAVAIALLTLVSSPWLLIIGAIILVITALILAGVWLWKNWDTIKEKGMKLWSWLKDIFAPEIVAFKIIMKLLGLMFKWIWDNKIKPWWDRMKSLFEFLRDEVLPIVKKIIGFTGGAIGKVLDVRKGLANKTADIAGVKRVNDFILRPNGQLLETNPNDTIFGSKNGMPGNTIIINIEGGIHGSDPEDLADALQDKLNKLINT